MQLSYQIADNPLHQMGKSEARSWIPQRVTGKHKS